MQILADENIDGVLVQWLREQGHEVTWIAELQPGATDETILELAARERRVLVTFDHDFGELVFHQRHTSRGVILLRLRAAGKDEMLAALGRQWPRAVKNAVGNFTVVTNTDVRVRQL